MKKVSQLGIIDSYVHLIAENSPDTIMIVDKEGVIKYINRTFGELTYYSVIETSSFDYLPEEHRVLYGDLLRDTLENNKPNEFEHKAMGSTWWRAKLVPVNGKEQGRLAIIISTDITQQKEYEEFLKSTVREKELLIKEIYHRVKNNLQTVISLINLQARASDNQELKVGLDEIKNRLYTMAEVHTVLCRSENLDRIKLGDYLEKICFLYQTSGNYFKLNIDADFEISLDDTVVFGLILNELISNSIKHGDKEDVEIVISIEKQENEIGLSYSDNGKGIPEEYNLESIPSLGLKLVDSLITSQLDGRYTIKKGSHFHLLMHFTPDQN